MGAGFRGHGGPEVQVFALAPYLCSVFRAHGSAHGVSTTHIDDILGCGQGDVLHSAQGCLGPRFGDSKVQDQKVVNVGMESTEAADLPAQLPQNEFADALKPIPTSSELRSSRQGPLSMGGLRMRQCKLGELRVLTTAS